MNFRIAGRRFACAALAASALAIASPVDALACTQIYVGPELTDNGDTLVGRSEDFASRHPKVFGIQESVTNPRYTSDESSLDFTLDGVTTYRYTYVRDTRSGWSDRTDAYSEAGINEKGLAVSATLTTGYNQKIAAVDPVGADDENGPWGIGEYTVTDIVLGNCATAREGVEFLGALVEEHGNYDNNQIVIADQDEVWIFQQLSGHQWAAIECDDNVASVNPNMGTLEYKVDINDNTKFLSSEGLVPTAEEAGSLVTFEDGTINIAASYGEEEVGSGQDIRYLQGLAYFGAEMPEFTFDEETGKVNPIEDTNQFFTPGKQDIDLFTMMRSFAARGEQDPSLDANLNSQHYAIGNNRTVETHLFQIRQDMDPEIATVQWQALSRAEFSLFLPSYSALLTDTSSVFGNIEDFDESHGSDKRTDSVEQALEKDETGLLDYAMMDINTLCYNHREECAPAVRAYLDAYQKDLIAEQEAFDVKMQAAKPEDRAQMATDHFNMVAERTFADMDELRCQLQDYVSAGNFDQKFEIDTVSFADVNWATPHFEDIKWLASEGITTGFDDGTFRPLTSVARCDMAAFLYRFAGSPEFTPSAEVKAMFSDVNEDTPHANEIWWLASEGISTGFDDGTFRPYSDIARCDMAAFLHRLVGGEVATPDYEDIALTDISADTPHAEDVVWMIQNEITYGFQDGTFRPYSDIARCDMAAFLHRLDPLMVK